MNTLKCPQHLQKIKIKNYTWKDLFYVCPLYILPTWTNSYLIVPITIWDGLIMSRKAILTLRTFQKSLQGPTKTETQILHQKTCSKCSICTFYWLKLDFTQPHLSNTIHKLHFDLYHNALKMAGIMAFDIWMIINSKLYSIGASIDHSGPLLSCPQSGIKCPCLKCKCVQFWERWINWELSTWISGKV